MAGPPGKADVGYTVAGVAIAIVGWIVGTALVSRAATFSAAPGISVFALVYVLAQADERLVELTLSIADAVATRIGKQLAPTTKAKALVALSAASAAGAAGMAGAAAPAGGAGPAATTAKEEADGAAADTHAMAFGLSLGFAFVACGYFEIGFLKLIGVTGTPLWVDRFLSALIIAGGSKPLHDLITKVQKSKEKDEQAAGG